MNEHLSQDEIEIDLKDIFITLWRKGILIAICTVVGAIAAFAFTKLLITPMYTSSSMIYILSQTTSITSLTDLQIGSSLTVDFEVLSESRVVLERVIEELELDMTYKELNESLTVNNPSNSRLLEFNVEHADPVVAAEISNSIAQNVADRVVEVMVTDKPSIVQPAVVATAPSSPSTVTNTAVGGLVGALICMAIIILRYFLNDTIKNDDDVSRFLGINTLASIPILEDDEKPVRKRKGAEEFEKVDEEVDVYLELEEQGVS